MLVCPFMQSYVVNLSSSRKTEKKPFSFQSLLQNNLHQSFNELEKETYLRVRLKQRHRDNPQGVGVMDGRVVGESQSWAFLLMNLKDLIDDRP